MIIYEGIVKRRKIEEIHRNLKDITINGDRKLLNYVMNVAKTMDKKIKKEEDEYMFLDFIFLFDKNCNMLINNRLKHDEGIIKDGIIRTEINDGRKNNEVFYIASSHKDSAQDHKDYQGKVYIDEKWRNYIKDPKTIAEINKYIQNNRIQTIQCVTGKPIWFITRPNCRHYFVRVGVDSVLKNKYHVPTRKIGDYTYQTPYGANLAYYEERLKVLKALYKVKKTQKLKNLILKTEILIKKWKKEI